MKLPLRRLVYRDAKRLRALAAAGVGVSCRIHVGTCAQPNIVDLARGRRVSVGARPAP